MRYIFLGLMVWMLTACLDDSSSSNNEMTQRPKSPKTKEPSKQPPSIPTL